MASHKGASFVIIGLLIVATVVFGLDKMRTFFVPRGFFFVDNNPARIIVPQEDAFSHPEVDPVASLREATLSNLGNTGRTLHFDADCATSKDLISIELDREIKLYNDSDVKHMVAIGPKLYTLRPQSVIGVAANDEGTWKVSCDGTETTAVVIVTK